MPSEAEFAEVFHGRARAMRRTAYLLCGDWHRAEDLVQAAFVKLYLAWPRVEEVGAADAYLRTTLLRTYLDQNRRRWHGERPTEQVPERSVPDAVDAVDDRLELMEALDHLPPRQRACLVLRYFEDCSVETAAAVLGCTTGTVKSTTSRGLDALRVHLHDLSPTTEGVRS